MSEPVAIAVIAAAYLCGSVPFGLLVGRARGIDVRATGSGNIGATNVARSLGKKLGALVLVLDAAKGATAVGLLRLALARGWDVPLWVVASAGFAAMIGHCYPIWLRLRGGKGVATALGVFLVIDPLVAGIGVLLFAIFYALFRIASIGSVVAAASFPLLLWVLARPVELVCFGVAGAALVIVKHRGNIARLLRREELKV